MAKIDVWRTAPPAFEGRSKSFVDGLHPEHEISLSLRPMLNSTAFAAMEMADRKVRQYVTGVGNEGGEVEPFPAVGGKLVEITETLCRSIANLCVMQCQDVGERYSFEELVALFESYPNAAAEIQEFARTVDAEGAVSLKNGSRVVTATASESPSES